MNCGCLLYYNMIKSSLIHDLEARQCIDDTRCIGIGDGKTVSGTFLTTLGKFVDATDIAGIPGGNTDDRPMRHR